MQVSLQINARWIITVDPDNNVLENHAVIIQDDILLDILPQQQANKYTPSNIIHLNDHALAPGFVNAHTHAAMSLLKGLADDLPLDEWLNEHIWPAETELADAAFVRDGSELAIAEMIKGGTTCFNDMYFFIDQTALAAEQVGIRACLGIPIIDFPTRWAKDLDEYISKGLAVHERFNGNELISFTFAPHAPYTVCDESLKTLQPIMDELGLPMHIHAHETNLEVEQSIAEHGASPIERLNKLGLLNPDLMAVHMTALSDADIQLIIEHRVNIIHCPESNLKLASGFCPISKLLQLGINVAIGTDGSASNNDIDMLGETRTAALLAKGVAKKADALPAHQALRMATLNGAKALGMDHKIGSLEIGKQADLFAINLNHLETQPIYDVISTLIYSANRSQISDVWVAGKQLMQNHELTTINETNLLKKAQQWQGKISPFHHQPYKAV
ncbi:MAG: TRZ/ATZ family hydrolase [Cycloclasticus sp.]|jgi:5-methylthioadenosine/S-adenosylhomocysteine deaminase|nr:MAG: N-ethylammeline chlorohydrolase [Cycloclasticus sp. Phe_18]MBV1913671.1 TRZ/ATZ family hydrolase [Cycloclasticus sp.]